MAGGLGVEAKTLERLLVDVHVLDFIAGPGQQQPARSGERAVGFRPPVRQHGREADDRLWPADQPSVRAVPRRQQQQSQRPRGRRPVGVRPGRSERGVDRQTDLDRLHDHRGVRRCFPRQQLYELRVWSIGQRRWVRQQHLHPLQQQRLHPLVPQQASYPYATAAGYNRMLWTAMRRKAAYLPGLS
jgi:hypothetical protein